MQTTQQAIRRVERRGACLAARIARVKFALRKAIDTGSWADKRAYDRAVQAFVKTSAK